MPQDSIPGVLRLVRMTPGTRQGIVVKEMRRKFASDLMDAWNAYVTRVIPPVLTVENCGPQELAFDAQLVLVYTFIDIGAVRETLYDWEPISATKADEFCREFFKQTLGEAERGALETPWHVQLPAKANEP